jgi:FkbM family methyltransferase
MCTSPKRRRGAGSYIPGRGVLADGELDHSVGLAPMGERMRLVALRRAIPGPLKAALIRVVGWAYWARRLVRQLLGHGRHAQYAPGPEPTATSVAADARLPADAPDCVVASNEHGLYCVPRSSQHRPVAQAILQSRVWESDTLELVCGAESTGDIVHAGTFFGDFLPALSRSRADGAIVWAFEPGGENHRCTEITALLNELANVVLTRAGLDAKGGTALLATGDREGLPLGGASRIITDPARARWWSNEEVRIVAVDEVVGADRRVAAIQLDVEGHELDALAGAMRTIERCRPLIVLETLPEASWIEEHLTPLGYRLQGSVNRNFVMHSA